MGKTIVYCLCCNKKIVRKNSAISNSGHNFCNHHCSASITNKFRFLQKSINKINKIKQSPKCARYGCLNRIGIENKIFCSNNCRKEAYQLDISKFKVEIINRIINFYNLKRRLPIKCEFSKEYKRILRIFGTWNNLIITAGYKPNPQKFAIKYISNDGHKCDSLSEKIVDDWLFARKIPHQVKVKYPWNNGMSVDFKVGMYWIELFGLCGQLKRYDNLMKIKLQNIKKYKLNLISLYLTDIFPVCRLEDKLDILRKQNNYL